MSDQQCNLVHNQRHVAQLQAWYVQSNLNRACITPSAIELRPSVTMHSKAASTDTCDRIHDVYKDTCKLNVQSIFAYTCAHKHFIITNDKAAGCNSAQLLACAGMPRLCLFSMMGSSKL